MLLINDREEQFKIDETTFTDSRWRTKALCRGEMPPPDFLTYKMRLIIEEGEEYNGTCHILKTTKKYFILSFEKESDHVKN